MEMNVSFALQSPYLRQLSPCASLIPGQMTIWARLDAMDKTSTPDSTGIERKSLGRPDRSLVLHQMRTRGREEKCVQIV
jgi:hypothetical protein